LVNKGANINDVNESGQSALGNPDCTFKYEKMKRFFLFLLCSLLTLWVQAQANLVEHPKGDPHFLYDVDGIPILEEETYYYLPIKKQFLSSEHFSLLKWKDKSFQAYFDSCYSHEPISLVRELNEWPLLFILFDDALTIKNVRVITRRLSFYDKEYDYNALVKRIVFSTAGKWMKRDSTVTTDWYYSTIRFRLN